MNENDIPKWQREMKSFLGIKSGIVLEGNIYDEYPIFSCEDGVIKYQSIDKLDEAISSLVDVEKTAIFFFSPVNGFYTYEDDIEDQKRCLKSLLEGYTYCESYIDHDCTVCFMPSGKKDSSERAENQKFVWMSEIVKRAMSDGRGIPEKKNAVFVLNFSSRLEDCNPRAVESNTMFLNLMAATTTVQASQFFCNTMIMIVDKYNDIPTWLYLNNPNIRTVSICAPDRNTRRLYISNLLGKLELFKELSCDNSEPGKQFIAETEGMKLHELKQILQLAYKKGIEPNNINLAFRLYKYGIIESPWENLENDILVHITANLEKRVKGQDDALKKVKSVIMRAVKGFSGLQHSGTSRKPKGILFFAGPTGVGKTETAKALAESIFGDENACIRFDMSEYRVAESDQKLFGAPPGYVGYEGGGQLTNAVKNRPFSVILFDEIEKASPTILDKFLQILEDGRMTDNQGNTVYFGESIIIFTSNIGLTTEVSNPDGSCHRVPTVTIENPMVEDTPEFRAHVTELLTEGVKSYFTDNGRPELLNRLGTNNIVVFQFISKKDAVKICDYKLDVICKKIKADKDIEIVIDDALEFLHNEAILERANGGRGVGNMLEREFLNPFAEYICSIPDNPSKLRCFSTDEGLNFEVIASDNGFFGKS
ncbi:MAG: AAA family ATPase [Oscillospiraceae bacterium]